MAPPETSTMRQRLQAALQEADANEPDSVRTQTLRLVICAITDRDIAARARGACAGCRDDEILTLLETMALQREKSARQYDEANRIADAEREREEFEIISTFLPKPLAGEMLHKAVADIINELDARKLKDVGRCMSTLRARFPGQIKHGPAGKAVREALTKAEK